MIIAFTGARSGMTEAQQRALEEVLILLRTASFREDDIFHHGAAIGADAQAAVIAARVGWRLVAHPSDHKQWTSEPAIRISDVVYKIKAPLVRNREMIDSSNSTHLLAAPDRPPVIRGSGTWYTVRYALRQKIRVIVIRPNGVTKDPALSDLW